MLPEVNSKHTDFILNYARKDGLSSIVRNLDLSEGKDHLQADLQADLIQEFSTKFPGTDLKELDSAVEWVLIMSIAKMKDKEMNIESNDTES